MSAAGTGARIARLLDVLDEARTAAANLVVDTGGPSDVDGAHRRVLSLTVQAHQAAEALRVLLALPPEQDG